MKKWEDLSKVEKEKVDAYIKIVSSWQVLYTTLLLLSGISVIVGLPLIFTRFAPFILVGMYLLFMSAIFVILVFCVIQQDNKRLFYIFGINNLTKDVFDISNEKLRKLRRVYIWKEEK
jgi:uncharacterized Tic20 family protein